MTTHSNILAWKVPWTDEPGGLQSRGSQRVRHRVTHTYFSQEAFCSVCLHSLAPDRKALWMLPPSSLQPLPIARFTIVFWGLLPHGDEHFRVTQETWVSSLLEGWVSAPSSHSFWESQTLSLDSKPVSTNLFMDTQPLSPQRSQAPFCCLPVS